MKTFTIDFKDIQGSGDVWNLFADTLDFPNYANPPSYSNTENRRKSDMQTNWNAFWDSFGFAIELYTKEGPVHLVLKNVQQLKKINHFDYDDLIFCLTKVTDMEAMYADPNTRAKMPPIAFTYELID